jgi:hypothetical protein
VAEVVPHQPAPDAAERLVDRRDLREHVGAVPVALDHALQPAHLALDPAQAGEVAGLDVGVDADRAPAVDADRVARARVGRRIDAAPARGRGARDRARLVGSAPPPDAPTHTSAGS